jgi:hypothetical protein
LAGGWASGDVEWFIMGLPGCGMPGISLLEAHLKYGSTRFLDVGTRFVVIPELVMGDE